MEENLAGRKRKRTDEADTTAAVFPDAPEDGDRGIVEEQKWLEKGVERLCIYW